MSADLIASLASSGMTIREAAASCGLPFSKFKDMRAQYKHIKWRTPDSQIKGLARGSLACSKLTPERAAMIFSDPRTPTEIAACFGVSDSTVCNIKARRVWRHATGA